MNNGGCISIDNYIFYFELNKHHKFLIATCNSFAFKIALTGLEDCTDKIDDSYLAFP